MWEISALAIFVFNNDVKRRLPTGVNHIGLLVDQESGQKRCTATVIQHLDDSLVVLTAAHCFFPPTKERDKWDRKIFKELILDGHSVEDAFLTSIDHISSKSLFVYQPGDLAQEISKVIFHPHYFSIEYAELTRRIAPEVLSEIPDRLQVIDIIKSLWRNTRFLANVGVLATISKPSGLSQQFENKFLSQASTKNCWAMAVEYLAPWDWIMVRSQVEKELENMFGQDSLNNELLRRVVRLFESYTHFYFGKQLDAPLAYKQAFSYDLALFETARPQNLKNGDLMRFPNLEEESQKLHGLMGAGFDQHQHLLAFTPEQPVVRDIKEGKAGLLKFTIDLSQSNVSQSSFALPFFGDSGAPLFRVLPDKSTELVGVQSYSSWQPFPEHIEYYKLPDVISLFGSNTEVSIGYVNLLIHGGFVDHYLKYRE